MAEKIIEEKQPEDEESDIAAITNTWYHHMTVGSDSNQPFNIRTRFRLEKPSSYLL